MKKITLLLLLTITSLGLFAAPIDESRAREIAESFFSGYSTRGSSSDVDLAWSGSSFLAQPFGTTDADATLYIYNRASNDGYVIVSGDDNTAPIVAFSLDRAFDVENMPFTTRRLLEAWNEQIAAARAGLIPPVKLASQGNVVKKYDTAQWSQFTPYNDECPIIDGYRAVTGCVATAMSIICHYNKWPKEVSGETPAYTYDDMVDKNTKRSIAANPLGPTYDYDNMLMGYYDSNGYSKYNEVQGAAVARLMHDMGTSVEMMYHHTGSGAFDDMVPKAFYTYFKYSKQATYLPHGEMSEEKWTAMLQENLAAYGPTYFSGAGEEGGHAFVLDGYTDAGYFHINYGWEGEGNGYYLLPKIDFYAYQGAVFYLEPDKDGTSSFRDFLVLRYYDDSYKGITTDTTEYVKGEAFRVWIGNITNLGNTAFTGDVALVLCDKDGEVKQTLRNYKFSGSDKIDVHYGTILGPVTVTISKDLAKGDRLRIYYKGANSAEWQWATAYDANAVDEIIVCDTEQEEPEEPEEPATPIDEALSFTYSKVDKTIAITSQIDVDYRLVYGTNTNIEYKVIKAGESATIDCSSLPAGSYTFTFNNATSESYVLKLEL
ncbi:MAG: C10 family peptidase [Alistipes sp.]|nr:C10 family peptidase [Alistipes sp.]